MGSVLVITDVERLQGEIAKALKKVDGKPGMYLSVNKTQKSTEEGLRKEGLRTERIFFVDCVTQEKTRDDVLHIPPQNLDLLVAAVQEFSKDIKGEKFILIDALSTLLIYNDENKVARFVKEMTAIGSSQGVQVIAFSPVTKGEELLEKIFNFFDEVRR
jgi:KaiC/GvpD/RAD55 family RecA-like ATPase